MMATRVRRAILLLGCLLLTACGETEPVKLGFIGGVSGRVADLGIGGRNGVTLAIEQQNQRGGIDGRPVTLLIEDDQQDPDVALAAVNRLLDARVEAILGPMTSAMAMTVAPRANRAKVLMMGITTASNALTGIDDYFVRAVPPTRVHAGNDAEYSLKQLGIRRVAIAYDLRNRSFTESWKKDFIERFTQLGGRIDAQIGFESSNALDFRQLTQRLLASQPEAVVSVSNSLDAVMISKEARSLDPDIQLITSEWGATERLLDMGGRHVEGMIAPQFFDRDSTDPGYLAFARDYQQRFGRKPGFPATIGYKATRVIIESLEAQQQGQSLKDALLAIGTFQGLQAPIVFDAYGDISTKIYLTEVRDGRFRLLNQP